MVAVKYARIVIECNHTVCYYFVTPLLVQQLIAKLEVQHEIAQCLIENKEFTADKFKKVTDDHDNKSKVRVVKKMKVWFYEMDGQYFTVIKYSSKSLDLSKGLYAIAVDNSATLTSIYDTVICAVNTRELDKQLMANMNYLPLQRFKIIKLYE